MKRIHYVFGLSAVVALLSFSEGVSFAENTEPLASITISPNPVYEGKEYRVALNDYRGIVIFKILDTKGNIIDADTVDAKVPSTTFIARSPGRYSANAYPPGFKSPAVAQGFTVRKNK